MNYLNEKKHTMISFRLNMTSTNQLRFIYNSSLKLLIILNILYILIKPKLF